jgi:hypothetical protein
LRTTTKLLKYSLTKPAFCLKALPFSFFHIFQQLQFSVSLLMLLLQRMHGILKFRLIRLWMFIRVQVTMNMFMDKSTDKYVRPLYSLCTSVGICHFFTQINLLLLLFFYFLAKMEKLMYYLWHFKINWRDYMYAFSIGFLGLFNDAVWITSYK